MSESATAIAAISALASIAAVLGWVIKYILKDFNSTQRELSKNIAKQSDVADKKLRLVEKQIASTEERDKRDAEFNKQVIKNFEDLNKKTDRNYKAISNLKIGKQVVHEQIVGKEIVKSKE